MFYTSNMHDFIWFQLKVTSEKKAISKSCTYKTCFCTTSIRLFSKWVYDDWMSYSSDKRVLLMTSWLFMVKTLAAKRSSCNRKLGNM